MYGLFFENGGVEYVPDGVAEALIEVRSHVEVVKSLGKVGWVVEWVVVSVKVVVKAVGFVEGVEVVVDPGSGVRRSRFQIRTGSTSSESIGAGPQLLTTRHGE